jgi:hypothetical protein
MSGPDADGVGQALLSVQYCTTPFDLVHTHPSSILYLFAQLGRRQQRSRSIHISTRHFCSRRRLPGGGAMPLRVDSLRIFSLVSLVPPSAVRVGVSATSSP